MTDLSRIKLKGTHLSPENFFRWLDVQYSVHDLRVQQGWLDSGKNKKNYQKILKRFNASNKSLYPLFIQWWRENGTIYRATSSCDYVLVQDRGCIVE